MRVKDALMRYIRAQTQQQEVIHLVKIKARTGKVILTIGSGHGSGTGKRYAIWQYTKACKCGEVAISADDPYRLAEYLIELCGREHLKRELPLYNYQH